ncbi:ATP-binding protein [Actinacidiphila sp. bgisy144]|uniref:ATP-binding protein n=1 Tax=Actinacidiphila sp. bgisy144 TaxID=3413791 RepID=UPI003EB6D4CB
MSRTAQRKGTCRAALRDAASSPASTSDVLTVTLGWTAPRNVTAAGELGARQVGLMRRLACAALDQWGLQAVAEDLALVISELVTNALRHGGGCTSVCLAHGAAGTIHLEVRQKARCLPQVLPTSAEDESGRGLLIVSSLSDSWGVGESGDSVWCTLAPKAGATS